MTVLITGDAGYVDSHIAWEFLDQGDSVVILDNLMTGVCGNLPESAVFVEACIGDEKVIAEPHSGIHTILVIDLTIALGKCKKILFFLKMV